MTESTTARFRDLGNGTIAELMSDQVQLFYDPTTQRARAIFNGLEYININATYLPIGNNHDILPVDFSDKIINCYGTGQSDPVTGADLSNISIAGFMVIIKAAYDKFVNEREDARGAAIAAAEAAAAEAAEAAEAGTADTPSATPTPTPTPSAIV